MSEFCTYLCKECKFDMVRESMVGNAISMGPINESTTADAASMDFSFILGRFDNHPCEMRVVQELLDEGHTQEEIDNGIVWYALVYDKRDKILKQIASSDIVDGRHIRGPYELTCPKCGAKILRETVAWS